MLHFHNHDTHNDADHALIGERGTKLYGINSVRPLKIYPVTAVGGPRLQGL